MNCDITNIVSKLYLFFKVMSCWFTVALVPEIEEHPGGGSFSRSLHRMYSRS